VLGLHTLGRHGGRGGGFQLERLNQRVDELTRDDSPAARTLSLKEQVARLSVAWRGPSSAMASRRYLPGWELP